MLPQSHFGVVSLSANNDIDPASWKNGILLGAGPNSIGDHSRDRTIVPSFGKNDLIIRQVKNHDFQKPENGSGYSR